MKDIEIKELEMKIDLLKRDFKEHDNKANKMINNETFGKQELQKILVQEQTNYKEKV